MSRTRLIGWASLLMAGAILALLSVEVSNGIDELARDVGAWWRDANACECEGEP